MPPLIGHPPSHSPGAPATPHQTVLKPPLAQIMAQAGHLGVAAAHEMLLWTKRCPTWLEVEVQSLAPIHEVADDVIHVALQVLHIHVKI